MGLVPSSFANSSWPDKNLTHYFKLNFSKVFTQLLLAMLAHQHSTYSNHIISLLIIIKPYYTAVTAQKPLFKKNLKIKRILKRSWSKQPYTMQPSLLNNTSSKIPYFRIRDVHPVPEAASNLFQPDNKNHASIGNRWKVNHSATYINIIVTAFSSTM